MSRPNLFRPSGIIRPITDAELHPTPLSGACCAPLRGGSCINPPRWILEYGEQKTALCGVHVRAARPQCAEAPQETAVRSALDRNIAEAKAATEGAILLFRLGDYYLAFDEDAEVVANVIGFELGKIPPTMLRRGVAVPRKQLALTDSGIERNIELLRTAGYRVALLAWKAAAGVERHGAGEGE